MDELKNAYDRNSPTYEELGSLKLGFNELSDLSIEEFQKMNGVKIKRKPNFNLQNGKRAMSQIVYIDSSSDIFKNYKSGVITNCGSTPSHSVTLVSIIDDIATFQNSWGSNWGDHGFGQISNSCIS